MVVFCTQTLLSSPLLSHLCPVSTLRFSFCSFSCLFHISLLVTCLPSLSSPPILPLPPPNPYLCFSFLLLIFCEYGRGDTTWLQLTPWRLPIRPLSASSLHCGGIHIHYVASLSPPPSLCFLPCFFFLHCTSVSHFPSPSLSGSPFRSVSLSPCLRGPPLSWLLLAAPVPPTLSLDMLFIGLQRGWLSVQGGCCLKQCSLNKRGKISRRALWLMCSLSASVYRHRAPRIRISLFSTVSH